MKVSKIRKKDFGMDKNVSLSQGLVVWKNFVFARFSVQEELEFTVLRTMLSGKDRTILIEKISYIKKSVSLVRPAGPDRKFGWNNLPAISDGSRTFRDFDFQAAVENLYSSFVKKCGRIPLARFQPGITLA